MYRKPETIKCPSCGHDTGLLVNGFLRVISPEGLKCPKCRTIVLRGSEHELGDMYERRHLRSKLLENKWEFVN